MAPRRLGNEADRRLHVLVGLVLLTGLTAIAAALTHVIIVAQPAPWALLGAMVALIVAAALINVEVRIGSSRHGLSWADSGMLVGLAVLPIGWLVLATATAVLIAEVIRRRQPVKQAFAVAKESTVALVGGLTLAALGGGLTTPATDLGSLALAFLVMTAVDELLVLPVLAAATHTRLRQRFRSNVDIRAFAAAGRFGVAAAAVVAVGLQPELLYTLPLLVLLAHLWHERWVRMREERQAWQRLAAITESFGVDLDELLRQAVTGGAQLFSADELEIEAWPAGEHHRVRGNAEQVTSDALPGRTAPEAASMHTVALQGQPGAPDIGVVRLRFEGPVSISEREQAMLSSYAAALDTAIRNAEAYGQLGAATAAHAHAAAHDPLTGLANRRELERHLDEALTDSTAPASHVAVLMIDLRHFKEVNDTLGHLTGDRVLVQVAQRLAAAAGRTDLVARFGGDEFAVLLRHADRAEQARGRAERLLDALVEPVIVDGQPLAVEACAGLALAVEYPPAGEHNAAKATAELMRRADVAMYHAKRSTRPLASYAPAADPADPQRLALAGALPRAVAQREFVLSFQPIVALATGHITGAEALARWRHPTYGQLPPGRFLDLLERSNQLGAFTAAVLDQALTTADRWRDAGHDLSVSVNVSPRSLLDAELPRMVHDALRAHRTPPDRLCLELTETLAISQLEVVDRVLHQLHDLGVALALDDFGTGYSSLAVLSRIPIDQLKVDRSFVNALHPWPDGAPAGQPGDHSAIGLPHPAQSTAVVRSTVQLGRALGMSVVAEGIETESQRRILSELGCHLGQGHMFAAPVTAEQLLSLLASRAALAEPLHTGPPHESSDTGRSADAAGAAGPEGLAGVIHLDQARRSGRRRP